MPTWERKPHRFKTASISSILIQSRKVFMNKTSVKNIRVRFFRQFPLLNSRLLLHHHNDKTTEHKVERTEYNTNVFTEHNE